MCRFIETLCLKPTQEGIPTCTSEGGDIPREPRTLCHSVFDTMSYANYEILWRRKDFDVVFKHLLTSVIPTIIIHFM